MQEEDTPEGKQGEKLPNLPDDTPGPSRLLAFTPDPPAGQRSGDGDSRIQYSNLSSASNLPPLSASPRCLPLFPC